MRLAFFLLRPKNIDLPPPGEKAGAAHGMLAVVRHFCVWHFT